MRSSLLGRNTKMHIHSMKIALKDLAAAVGGRIEGDETAVIESFSQIENATPGSITFLANPKYTHYIYETEAAAVLVSETFVPERPVHTTLLRVKDPYSTLAELMTMAQRLTSHAPQGIEQPVYLPDDFTLPEQGYIGAFTYIGKGVKLGKGVKIYPQVYLGDDVEIGDNTVIRAGVKVYEGCRIGARCIIHSGVVIGADGFGFAPLPDGSYEKIPQMGIVEISDDVEVGANTTIDRATFGSTKIGAGTKLDNLIQVAHNVEIGRNNVFAAQVGIAGSTRIGDSNVVAGQVGFAGHIRVGDRNVIGAQSGVPNSVDSNKRLLGYPAVDARQFAKNLVYIKKLPELFKDKNNPTT